MQSDLLNSQDLVKTSFFDDVSEKIQADEYPLNVFWVSPKEFQNFSKKNSHVSKTILPRLSGTRVIPDRGRKDESCRCR